MVAGFWFRRMSGNDEQARTQTRPAVSVVIPLHFEHHFGLGRGKLAEFPLGA